MPEERLQKLLARAGLGSRRACEVLISSGRVTVDGVLATLGGRADPMVNHVEVDGHRIPLDPTLRYFALHKPVGVVTSLADDRGQPDLSSILPKEPRLFPVGRLDQDSEGLLLVTNDGDLAHRLAHPSFGVEKEYLAEVEGVVQPSHLAALKRGVDLEDGPARAVKATSEGSTGERGAVRVVMVEGRKREVRRLLSAVGLPVTRLIRLRVGPVRLEDLPAGQMRELDSDAVRGLFEVAGL